MAAYFRERVHSGEILLGTLVTLDSPAVTEILVDSGYDWLFIDCEHSAFDAAGVLPLLQAVDHRCPCLIRVPVGDEVWIKKALDIGAAGIIAPQVNTVEQAQRIIGYCKYPPIGTRGVGIARAHGYGYGFSDYVKNANDLVTVVIQVEHIDAVRNIHELVQVEGIDAILIGPYDLSASMGKIGQVGDPEVLAAITEVSHACKQAGIPLGGFGTSAEAVQGFIDQGFTLIAVGCDVLFLSRAAQQTLNHLRQYIPNVKSVKKSTKKPQR